MDSRAGAVAIGSAVAVTNLIAGIADSNNIAGDFLNTKNFYKLSTKEGRQGEARERLAEMAALGWRFTLLCKAVLQNREINERAIIRTTAHNTSQLRSGWFVLSRGFSRFAFDSRCCWRI